MQLRVLGGCGAWPAAGRACSGYLFEHDGFRLLVDPGYATLPRLLEVLEPDQIDAVLTSHGHADHTADLHPLLRARVLGNDEPAVLPVWGLPGSLAPVLALDRPGLLDPGYRVMDFNAGDTFEIGPFRVQTWPLPHSLPNAGLRLSADGSVVSYTGDTGPSPNLVELARGADLFLAESSYAERVPADSAESLSSALQAGENAGRAGVGRLWLTHLLPETNPELAAEMAARSYGGEVAVADRGLTATLD
jgi:ribonuclease BN (tRNA processing enzyme)